VPGGIHIDLGDACGGRPRAGGAAPVCRTTSWARRLRNRRDRPALGRDCRHARAPHGAYPGARQRSEHRRGRGGRAWSRGDL